MMFEYLIVAAQEGRVTWENGSWAGREPFQPENSAAALASCAPIHAYLAQRGCEGWELVAVTTGAASAFEKFYLKRRAS